MCWCFEYTLGVIILPVIRTAAKKSASACLDFLLLYKLYLFAGFHRNGNIIFRRRKTVRIMFFIEGLAAENCFAGLYESVIV